MAELGIDPGPTDRLGLIKRTRPFVWGFASQAASSATNFALSLVAALLLGPTGLGKVFVGFSAYLVAFGFQRALITDPLVSASSTLEGGPRIRATRAALMSLILWAAMSTLILATASVLAPGEVGRGLILFVPWLLPALLQDFWRVILFRDGRGRAAVTNDVLWVAVMGLMTPLIILYPRAWVVVGAWGLGAVAGTILGFLQTGIRPDALIPSIRWWRHKAWPLGGWLGAEGIVYTLGSQGLIFVLASILSIRSLGGIRAVQTLFAPLSLLLPAIVLPGLPEMSRRAASSAHRARRLALLLGAAAATLTGCYVLIGVVAGRGILTLVFGQEFGVFDSLILPVAVGQLFVASTVGFVLLLKAQMRGKALLWPRIVGSLATVALASGLAASHGVIGAAWGMAIGSAISSLLLSALALLEFAHQLPKDDASMV